MLSIRSISQPEELWQIFEEELKDHLSILLPLLDKGTYGTDENRKLSHRFHRLKGSLGFIGFSDFFSQVGDLENLLKMEDKTFTERTSDVLKELQLLLNDISSSLKQC